MNSLHLAIVCEEFPPAPHGGTGSSYHDLARGLVAKGHRVTVVAPSVTRPIPRRVDETEGLLTVHRLPRAWKVLGTRWGGIEERLRVKRVLREVTRRNAVSLVEASDYNGWLSMGALEGVPSVVKVRGSNVFFDAELGRQRQLFEAGHEINALRKASHIASVSRYAAEKTMELAGIADRPFQVVYNAVDTEFFSPGGMNEVEEGLVVFVNTVCQRKGIEPLMEAMNRVFALNSNARLAVVGACPGGDPYIEGLKAKVDQKFQSRVEFVGRLLRGETLQWLRKAAVCCYPSFMETFGIAALEAMAVGRPTVFSKYGPGPELIEHGVTGLLCDPHSIDDLTGCLSQLLERRDVAEPMGAAARQSVLARFDLPGWISRNETYYRSLLS